jgi:hypothetical protein
MCVHYQWIKLIDGKSSHTDNIRATGQVSQRVWCITQIINEHIEETRQKARKGSRRKAGCTKTTSRRADLYRGPQTGERSKETTEKDQGRIEAGSGTPTLTGKAGSEGEDKGVAHMDHFPVSLLSFDPFYPPFEALLSTVACENFTAG